MREERIHRRVDDEDGNAVIVLHDTASVAPEGPMQHLSTLVASWESGMPGDVGLRLLGGELLAKRAHGCEDVGGIAMAATTDEHGLRARTAGEPIVAYAFVTADALIHAGYDAGAGDERARARIAAEIERWGDFLCGRTFCFKRYHAITDDANAHALDRLGQGYYGEDMHVNGLWAAAGVPCDEQSTICAPWHDSEPQTVQQAMGPASLERAAASLRRAAIEYVSAVQINASEVEQDRIEADVDETLRTLDRAIAIGMREITA